MRSKVARKIFDETPQEVRNKVRQCSNRRMVLIEVWEKWCELDYKGFDAWLHKAMHNEVSTLNSRYIFDILMDNFEKDQTMNVQNAVSALMRYLNDEKAINPRRQA